MAQKPVLGTGIQRFAFHVYSNLTRLGLLKSDFSQSLFQAAYFRYKSLVEDPFRRLIHDRPEYFRQGHVLDVGANIGYTTSLFCDALSPGFKVFSFEPEPVNYRQLKRLSENSRYQERIVPTQAAVGDRQADTYLSVNPTDHSDHRLITPQFAGLAHSVKQLPIRMITLDGFVDRLPEPRPIAFIKIDIQGYEGPALRGMSRILQNNPKAVIALEYCRPIIEELGFDPDEIARYFQERGYSIYKLTRERGMQPIAYTDIDASVGNRGYMDLVFTL